MNVSEAFTKCMQDMHKRNLEKNYQQKTIEQRLTNFQGARRQTRDTFMLQRRNIDLNNMSPIVTPRVTKKKATTQKTQEDAVKPVKSNKRLEMLQKWKEEKEKLKKEAKKKAKPIFKVYHVTHEVAAAELEKVNKEIKGKPIKKDTGAAKPSWAPLNHKFRPPKNIKPIEVLVAPSKPTNQPKNPLNSKALDKASPVRRVTRAQSSRPEEKQKLTLDAGKRRKNGKIEQPEAKIKKPVTKKEENPVASKPVSKKNVGWDVDDMSDEEIVQKTSIKKRYAKTPIKRKKSVISVSDEDEECCKTPQRQMKVSTSSIQKPSGRKQQHAKRFYDEEESPTRKSDKVTIYSDEEVTLKTPRKKTPKHPSPTYISPFVTISRGKESARKEFQSRLSTGGTLAVSKATSPKMGAEYFARMLEQEVERLEGVCVDWERYKEENELSEEAQTMIFVPIGQCRLLVSKKFQQFRGLIDKCRRDESEGGRPITCKDLHGFWDMIYMQVEDLDRRFENLERLRRNGWEEVAPPPEKRTQAKRAGGRPKRAAAPPSRLRDFIRAARGRKGGGADEAAAAAAPSPPPPPAEPAPITPTQAHPHHRPSSARRSLRVSLLCGKTPKRPSTSPCVAMMRISQALRATDVDGSAATPSKSILKREKNRAVDGGAGGSMSKSVLFKDELEGGTSSEVGNKENVGRGGNLICFSPKVVPTRRSSRLGGVKL